MRLTLRAGENRKVRLTLRAGENRKVRLTLGQERIGR